MRVIGGIYKRRRFEVPPTFKARPTTDFAKENLFNVLMHYIDFEDGAKALDLFAGTGSITVELLSRGCRQVVSVEKDARHFAFIVKVIEALGTTAALPIKGDVFKFIERGTDSYDFIFADPPYALPNLAAIPDLILSKKMLNEDGVFVLEHGKDLDFSTHPHFREHRQYGSVNFSFFKATVRTDEE